MIMENQMEKNVQQWKPAICMKYSKSHRAGLPMASKVLRDTKPYPFERTVVSVWPLLGLRVTFGASGSLDSFVGLKGPRGYTQQL